MPWKNKEKQREYNRRYRALHPDLHAKWQKKYRDAGRKRRTTLMQRFGITDEVYAKMLDKQGGVCKICRKPETQMRKEVLTKLSVDHCHKKNRVRGLLCSKCNRGLGYFLDDTALLLAAIDYLKEYVSE